MDRRKFLVASASAASASMFPRVAMAAYPEKDIQGIIQWGAGGATDLLCRGVQPGLERQLKRSVIMVNRAGASGAIGMTQVLQAPADGYTLLFAAESPHIYKVLGLSQQDFDDFVPINIFSSVCHMFVVKADSPYKTFNDLIADIKKRPGAVRAGGTGAAGGPTVVGAMMKNVMPEWSVASVPFDSDGFAITGVLSGAVEFHICTQTASTEMVRSGKMRGLAVVNAEPVEPLREVPPISEFLPGVKKFLPWGSWFGAWAKRGTPKEVMDVLVPATRAAVSEPDYQALTRKLSSQPLNITGAEAEAYAKRSRSVTSWLLYEAGVAKHSPEKFGIARI